MSLYATYHADDGDSIQAAVQPYAVAGRTHIAAIEVGNLTIQGDAPVLLSLLANAAEALRAAHEQWSAEPTRTARVDAKVEMAEVSP